MTGSKHKPDECEVTGKLVNTHCLSAAPKNGSDLQGDNKEHCEEVIALWPQPDTDEIIEEVQGILMAT